MQSTRAKRTRGDLAERLQSRHPARATGVSPSA